jgi:hypothetical protein
MPFVISDYTPSLKKINLDDLRPAEWRTAKRRCHRCPFHLGESWNKTIQAKDASKPSEAQQSMAATNKGADSRQLANRRNRGGGSAAYPFRHPSIRTAANEVGASQLKTHSGFRES